MHQCLQPPSTWFLGLLLSSLAPFILLFPRCRGLSESNESRRRGTTRNIEQTFRSLADIPVYVRFFSILPYPPAWLVPINLAKFIPMDLGSWCMRQLVVCCWESRWHATGCMLNERVDNEPGYSRYYPTLWHTRISMHLSPPYLYCTRDQLPAQGHSGVIPVIAYDSLLFSSGIPSFCILFLLISFIGHVYEKYTYILKYFVFFSCTIPTSFYRRYF